MWQPQGIFNQYVLRTPVILSGEKSVYGLSDFPAAKIVVIHGSSFNDEELFRSVFAKKEIHFLKRSWEEEPDFSGIKGTLGEMEKLRPDTIIAAGGGSVIDGSKLCRLLLEDPSYVPGDALEGPEVLKTHFIAVPTTVGSGAEVSGAAVYIDRTAHRKDMVISHELIPEAVVYDPGYVRSLSVRALASSLMDAMAHILEGYVSVVENSFVNVLAEEGLALLREAAEGIVNNAAGDMDYSRLQYAGFLGGIVQNHCIVGAAHAVAHQFGDRGFAHGEAVALLLPAVIRLNMSDEATAAAYSRIAHRSGFKDTDDIIDHVQRLLNVSGIEERISDIRTLLNELSDDETFINNVMEDKGGRGNPIPITRDYIQELIRSI